MNAPDCATRHNPDPAYLRQLLERAGVSQRGAARALGIDERTMRRYLSMDHNSYRPAPYVIQYALEQWTESAIFLGRG